MLWKEIFNKNFTKVEELLDFLEMKPALRSSILQRPRFPLNLPRRLAEKIEKNNPHDPLFLQFVPLQGEEKKSLGYTADPVCDQTFRVGKKGLKKYAGRALLVTTGACAMHCRFCFRKNFPYEKEEFGFEEEISWLEEDESIQEVILSGGDPLSLSERRLGMLLERLGNIRHIKRIRFHTRFPIGIPERIDPLFLQQLSACPKQVFFVIHANHGRELDEDVMNGLKKILGLGIPVLCQTVLLKGVNDTVEALIELCERLIDRGVLPYYLHMLDPVEGTEQFHVEEAVAIHLVEKLRERLSGYGVPQLVREIPGSLSKTPIYDLLHSIHGS